MVLAVFIKIVLCLCAVHVCLGVCAWVGGCLSAILNKFNSVKLFTLPLIENTTSSSSASGLMI